ncbi:OLC1v1036966C1 [Oldenlandia corymbosa var. corymbosa]|uniref:OLC1v1036966C1 n=1 Tax=Oldenlandia corymbosa var. corymbosa TaxID=529605 RepID=A0AAV1CWH9_OLDCO|nr:OLC1v1036966C1 [Oldenlandia corymbosa var. corymbosa]
MFGSSPSAASETLGSSNPFGAQPQTTSSFFGSSGSMFSMPTPSSSSTPTIGASSSSANTAPGFVSPAPVVCGGSGTQSSGSSSTTPACCATVTGGSLGVSSGSPVSGSVTDSETPAESKPAPCTTSVGSLGVSPAGSSSFGQSSPLFVKQQRGSRAIPYTETPECDQFSGGRHSSIAAMPPYKHLSHEELRFEDYEQGDKGTPASEGTFHSPLPSTTLPPSHPFAPKTSASTSLYNHSSSPFPAPSLFTSGPSLVTNTSPFSNSRQTSGVISSNFSHIPPSPMFQLTTPGFGPTKNTNSSLFGQGPTTITSFGSSSGPNSGFSNSLFSNNTQPCPIIPAFGTKNTNTSPFGQTTISFGSSSAPASGFSNSIFNNTPAFGGSTNTNSSTCGQVTTPFSQSTPGSIQATSTFNSPAPGFLGNMLFTNTPQLPNASNKFSNTPSQQPNISNPGFCQATLSFFAVPFQSVQPANGISGFNVATPIMFAQNTSGQPLIMQGVVVPQAVPANLIAMPIPQAPVGGTATPSPVQYGIFWFLAGGGCLKRPQLFFADYDFVDIQMKADSTATLENAHVVSIDGHEDISGGYTRLERNLANVTTGNVKKLLGIHENIDIDRLLQEDEKYELYEPTIQNVVKNYFLLNEAVMKCFASTDPIGKEFAYF